MSSSDSSASSTVGSKATRSPTDILRDTQDNVDDLYHHINTATIDAHLIASQLAGYKTFLDKANRGLDKIKQVADSSDKTYQALDTQITNAKEKIGGLQSQLDAQNAQIKSMTNTYKALVASARSLNKAYKPKAPLSL